MTPIQIFRAAALVMFFSATFSAQSAVSQTGTAIVRDQRTATKVVNLLPDFLTFWDISQTLPADKRAVLFRKMMIAQHPEEFSKGLVYLAQDDGIAAEDTWITNRLADMTPTIPAIRKLNARLQSDLPTYIGNFQEVFPDYRAGATVYFTISMNSFDGRRAEISGKQALLFGVDVIARTQGAGADLSVLFDHELFHLYHGQVWPALFGYNGQIWQALWGEGLATYVAWRMNPNSTEANVLLNPTLASQARPKLAVLAQDLLINFHSEDDKVAAPYFSAGNPPSFIPDRSGYFVGFVLAMRVGRTHSLSELAHLEGAALEHQVLQGLEALAREPVETKILP